MEEKLIIASDLDGVVFDLVNFYKRYCKDFFNKDEVNSSGYSPMEIYEVSRIQEILFGLFYGNKYAKSAEIITGMDELLQRYTQIGDEIHCVTSRKFSTMNNALGRYSRKAIFEYMRKIGVAFDSYNFCGELNGAKEKYIACKTKGVDVIFEDLPSNALYIASNNIYVALKDAPYNKDVKHEYIRTCYNNMDFYEFTEEIRYNKNKEKTR